MLWSRLRSKEWIITLLGGLFLFATGLLILHRNPYWRTAFPIGTVPARVNAWNGIGHVTCGIGLALVFGNTAYLLSRLFSAKWLYWTGVVAAVVLWCGTFGIAHTYAAHYEWDARMGITSFAVSNPAASQQSENALWQTFVRWQVEPELNGWLRASSLKRTHGWLSIKVVRIVPLALPSIDCDCFDCCAEEDSATSGR